MRVSIIIAALILENSQDEMTRGAAQLIMLALAWALVCDIRELCR